MRNRISMTRYLLYLSYIGTHFRGVQKAIVKSDPGLLDPLSIQGLLDIALRRFRPLNEPTVYISSRTDQGVHALRSSAHVDLERAHSIYDPSFLTYGLNRYFEKAKADLKVQSCQIVPDTFHARHSAKSRTYLYRIAVRRQGLPTLPKNSKYLFQIPFGEWKRCTFIHDPCFDISLLQSAASLLPGVRDFRMFMCSSSNQYKDLRTVRQLNTLNVEPGRPMLEAQYSPSSEQYEYWDITFNGRSFLYKQVRRTVGALIAVAQGRISLEKIQSLLDNPSSESWDPRAVTAPPYGLYLVNVEYSDEDLRLPSEHNVGNT